MQVEYTVMADVDATYLFHNENNLRYCKERATFVHQDACEFILHIGSGEQGMDHSAVIAEMKAYGCSSAFIMAYVDVRDAGAVRVLFYT